MNAFLKERENSVRIIRLAALLLLMAFTSQAQQLIRGLVADSATFSSLPNVSVKLKNTLRGTTTDAKGNFSITAAESDTLVFTIIGYKRLELPLAGYETGMILLTEQPMMLAPVDVYDSKLYQNPYDGMFDEERAKLKKKIPFYYSKARKDRMKAANWREQEMVVQTYVDVVINNPQTKDGLMKQFKLSEKEYYDLLTLFNEQHYKVMYFLTSAELASLINKFFESHAPLR